MSQHYLSISVCSGPQSIPTTADSVYQPYHDVGFQHLFAAQVTTHFVAVTMQTIKVLCGFLPFHLLALDSSGMSP